MYKDQQRRATALNQRVEYAKERLQALKGEGPGHPFRGNQYTEGEGGGDDKSTAPNDSYGGGGATPLDHAIAMYGSALDINYRSSAHRLASAGEALARGRGSLKDVKTIARFAGLDKEQADIVEGAFREAKSETKERGVKIPMPKDPKEAEAYQRAIAARRARGGGKFVGDP